MKKQPRNDYTVLIYSIIFCIIAIFLLFIMFSGVDVKTNKSVTTELPHQINRQASSNVQNTQKEVSVPKPTIADNLPSFENYIYSISYDLNVQGTVKNLIFKTPVPIDELDRQYVLNSRYSIKPTKTYYEDSTKYAEFDFPQLSNQKLNISIIGSAKVRTYDLKTAKLINKNITPEKDINRYLQEEKYIEVNDPTVKNYASKIKGETKEEIVQNMYEFIQKHMTYKHLKGVSGAKRALNEKVGECSEYSAIMVALCRAKGIPARIVSGNIAREQATKHNWVEVYFDEYGWVTFDPTTMPMLVNVYKNGKLLRQEKRYDSNKSPVKYISSGKNIFSPYWLRYGSDSVNSGRVTIKENVKIKSGEIILKEKEK